MSISSKVNMTKQLDLFEVPSVTLRGGEGGGLELSDIMMLGVTKTCPLALMQHAPWCCYSTPQKPESQCGVWLTRLT